MISTQGGAQRGLGGVVDGGEQAVLLQQLGEWPQLVVRGWAAAERSRLQLLRHAVVVFARVGGAASPDLVHRLQRVPAHVVGHVVEHEGALLPLLADVVRGAVGRRTVRSPVR